MINLKNHVYEPIDLCACFDPMFFPPKTLELEWERLRNPFRSTMDRKIGNTLYRVETMCGGNESLLDKAKRLIFSC